MRCRITFSKTEAMRFTSHLDLHRTLERTMRRANLPLAYSEGFTPRPKLSLASALPLGFTSDAEVADFWLKEEIPPSQVERAFNASQPPGIRLYQVEQIALDTPKLQTSLTGAKYAVTLTETVPELESKVARLLIAEQVFIEKIKKGKKKTVDLRPLIVDVTLTSPEEAGTQILEMTLKAEPGATGRPDHILEVLNIDPLTAHIHRTSLIFS
jgi:radical SAM-linked protein